MYTPVERVKGKEWGPRSGGIVCTHLWIEGSEGASSLYSPVDRGEGVGASFVFSPVERVEGREQAPLCGCWL